MFYTRGSSDDYNRFASVTGDPGWSWENILPYILKVIYFVKHSYKRSDDFYFIIPEREMESPC